MKKWELSAPVSRATEVWKTQAGWTFYSPRCTALWQDTADTSNDSKTLAAGPAAETLPGFKWHTHSNTHTLSLLLYVCVWSWYVTCMRVLQVHDDDDDGGGAVVRGNHTPCWMHGSHMCDNLQVTSSSMTPSPHTHTHTHSHTHTHTPCRLWNDLLLWSAVSQPDL